MTDFLFPDFIPDLSEAGEFADCYEPAPDGGYALTDLAKKEVAQVRAELAAFEAGTVEEVEKLDTELAAKTVKFNELSLKAAIRDALREQDIAPGYCDWIVERLAELFDFNIQEDADGTVHIVVQGAYGLEELEVAIDRWLQTDEAKMFTCEKTSKPGEFSMAVRKLKLH